MLIKKTKTFRFKTFNTWREKKQNIQDIMVQTSLFLQSNDIIKRVVHLFKTKVLFSTVI